MNYPVWEVPYLGSAWVIGLIAIFHVMISQFAVGGGIYLPLAEGKAYKEGRRDWLPLIKAHSRFFLLITGVFGTVSGVGIWFAIGLVHPEATSTLIHNFVFGWAIEWVFFLVELTSAAVYYYTWDRIPDKLHLKVGYVYAFSSFCTLVIINGILSFMLTPGDAWISVAGTGREASQFWPAIFNPTYWPSLCLRTLVCLALAGIWALVTLSRIHDEKVQTTRIQMIRWSASWLVPSFVLMPLCFLWYLAMVPSDSRGLMQLGMSTIGSGMFTQVTRVVLLTVMTTMTVSGVVYFFAYQSPEDFSFGHAVAVLCLALAATASTEDAREMLRKPFVIGRHMYSNGVRVSQVDGYNRDGYLTQSLWAKDALASDEQVAIGRAMFRGQCMSCHTTDGFRSMKRLIGERDARSIASLLANLHASRTISNSPYKAYMPPLVGKPEEIAALAVYLQTLTPGGSTTLTALPSAVAPAPAASSAATADGAPSTSGSASAPAPVDSAPVPAAAASAGTDAPAPTAGASGAGG